MKKDFKDFLKAMAFWKTLESEKEEDDLVDAFVAMGGNPDKTGTVDAKSLIRTVKNEFELTIDIERLIMEIDGDKSGKIDYYEFKNLLSN